MNAAGQAVLTLRPEQVAQHPDNLRDASRDIAALAASIKEVGILVPLLVVPVDAIAGEWGDGITHVAVDGNRRQRAAEQVGADLPCIVHNDITSARDTAVTMTVTVTGLARDGWTLAEEVHGVQTLARPGAVAVGDQPSERPANLPRSAPPERQRPCPPRPLSTRPATNSPWISWHSWPITKATRKPPTSCSTQPRTAGCTHAAALIERERKAEQARAAVVAELATQGIAVSDQFRGTTPPRSSTRTYVVTY